MIISTTITTIAILDLTTTVTTNIVTIVAIIVTYPRTLGTKRRGGGVNSLLAQLPGA